MKERLVLLFVLAGLLSCAPNYGVMASNLQSQSSQLKAHKNAESFHQALKTVDPGDTLLLANGIWKDAELKIYANGTANKIIYILAETKGKVFLEGQSNVKIGGKYVHLEGLVFRNGYTPSNSAITFQIDKETSCSYCRVTECVIDNYNPPERFDSDYWVEIYGQHNRFDHCYLIGKRNKGVALAVRLKDVNDRENYHRIDHNYFGYRPILGANGGETLRIGTSHFSLSNSNTIVEDNYFENCNGELEIISNKSCKNIFRNNTFYESQGTLTMRHGNETLVENNYFFGNRKPNTGGIRVINETQTVRNNYLQGITGYRFRGALVVMNGVPNSPLNRYHQVKDSEISNNLVLDSDYIQLCAGSDEERSLTPISSSFKNNIIHSNSKDDVFTIYDDVSGINFEGNVLSTNIKTPAYKEMKIVGMTSKELIIDKSKNVWTVEGYSNVGPNTSKPIPNKLNTGVNWYTQKNYQIRFKSARKIIVPPGKNTIYEAAKNAQEGDVLVLQNGIYHQTKTIQLSNTISICSKGTKQKTILTFSQSPLFTLENGGSLELENLSVNGKEAIANLGNALISTSQKSMINNYKLFVKNCDISDLDVNQSFNFLKVYKNTFADSILIINSTFKDITGHILNMDKEKDGKGIYNAEDVIVENCKFENIGGSAIKLLRGGKDESTFGPLLWVKNSSFKNVGNDIRNKNESAIHLHGVQYAELSDLNIKNSEKIHLHLIVGDPVISLENIVLENSSPIYSNSKAYSSKNVNEINW